ncbi:MAG: hypothetical protein AAFX10_06460 [Pseudomonadota bacterium]
MKKTLSVLILSCMLAATAAARDLPSYYPQGTLRNVGSIDSVLLNENRVVIDDATYTISDDVVVHSMQSYSVGTARLRPGTVVAFRTRGRVITNIWLLPDGYGDR